MQKIVLGVVFLVCCVCISAQTVRIRPAGAGKIAVTKGKLRAVIDLSKNAAGCIYVPAEYRLELDKKACAAGPVTFKLLDATVKSKETFIVIESEAMGNCNVCGRCGATEAFALIWLRLGNRLQVIDKKSLPVEDCIANISLLGNDIAINENTQDQSADFKFTNDLLVVETEKTIYTDSDERNYEFSRLEYNRKTPEKGFIIKTEKRANSSSRQED